MKDRIFDVIDKCIDKFFDNQAFTEVIVSVVLFIMIIAFIGGCLFVRDKMFPDYRPESVSRYCRCIR